MTIGIVQRRSSETQEQPTLNQHPGHHLRNVPIWSALKINQSCRGCRLGRWDITASAVSNSRSRRSWAYGQKNNRTLMRRMVVDFDVNADSRGAATLLPTFGGC